MKKMLLTLLILNITLTASEFQYGKGRFDLAGGFLGLEQSIGTDISTFTLANPHANLPLSHLFYSYDVTWMDSQQLQQAQQSYNNLASTTNNFFAINTNEYLKVPAMEHRVKGLDANLRFGYDILHQDEDNFLGLGVLVGLSIPWIDSSKDNDASPSFGFIRDNSGNLLQTADYFKQSKTSIMTYKIGPSINFKKTLISDKLSLYGIGSFAYQTGSIENDAIDSKLSVNGTFQEYNLGLYYTPFTEKYQWGWLTLSPRIYTTLGYKYSKWDVDNAIIDISGAKLSSDILDPLGMKFSMESAIGYLGVGYSF
ncbi:MAG TPA: hypothetical protein ENK95_04055 [Campylobacterales bacterium]|nr:hypothetical protein [Campylobacterales bacterium]